MKQLITLAIILLMAGCEKNDDLVRTRCIASPQSQQLKQNKMAKVLTTYRNFTATEINTRSSAVGSHAVVSSTVEFTDIQFSKVRDVLGITDTSLSGLCTSNNVNQWSKFSPYLRSYSGAGSLTSTFVNTKPTTNYKIGDFAGYNHTATAPGWGTGNKANAELPVSIITGTAPTFTASFYIGEIDYPNAQGVALTIWQNGELKGFHIEDINQFKDRVDIDCELPYTLSTSQSFIGKIFIVDNTTQFLQSGGNVLCKVPNLDDYTVQVNILAATQLIVDAGGFTVTGAAYNSTTGYVSFTNATYGANITSLLVKGELYNAASELVGSVTLYSGAYTANTSLGALSGYLGMAPIPAYGYTVKIVFEESE